MSDPQRVADTALLVVDVQVGVVADIANSSVLVPAILSLVEGARSSGIPVIWVRHRDEDLQPASPEWQIVPELVPAADEPIIEKEYHDSFDGTDLATVLADRNIERIIVCGAESDACVLSTVFGGYARGYSITLVGDAHSTSDKTGRGLPPPEEMVGIVNAAPLICGGGS